jgi:hypothetical protein
VIKHVTVFAAVVLAITVRAAEAQPQIALSTTTVAPGQPVAITVTGTPGVFFALIGSSVNSGFSYAGVPLAVGPDVQIITIGTLNASGTASVSFTPPFNGTPLDRYYVQAATSTAANFIPLQASHGAVIRNADLVNGILGNVWTGTPTVDVPAGSYVLQSMVQVVNSTGAEFVASCHLAGSFTGVSYPAAIFVPAGKTDTIPMLAAVTVAAPTTISVLCATTPPPGIGFLPAIIATQVGTITGPTP